MSVFTRKILLPLLLITVLSISAVELFYTFGEKYLQRGREKATQPSVAEVAEPEQIIKDVKKPIDDSIITRRNLFASREGSAIKAKQTTPVTQLEMSSLDVVLMGTVSGTDDGQRAIIYDKKDKKQELFQVGDYIQQAIIKQILRGKVILSLNGKDEFLDISEARNVPIPRVAKVSPVVQTRKVVGRPVGQQAVQQAVQAEEQPNGNNIAGEVQQPTATVKRPKQLRSFKGGVIVRDKANNQQ